ncbi:unnamed protein product [Acanthoscelides obtectus]|uniref:Uncharacterized protein n=1 Tax=Acanthoscelides obtectus TaxID=200917 RepID=A0A9P0JZY0_ACAOB|nr:unnamed protein product [Acanthoscelides obtectus]CAK1640834.1 hypothetical protein AOBTE_LOCUS11955 [Acanthoscelides obtectus]
MQQFSWSRPKFRWNPYIYGSGVMTVENGQKNFRSRPVLRNHILVTLSECPKMYI